MGPHFKTPKLLDRAHNRQLDARPDIADRMKLSPRRWEESLGSELICDADLEKMLHHRQLKRDIQRAARGRRATSAGSRSREGKGIRSAWIIEPRKAILSAKQPIGRPESILKPDRRRPAKRGGRLLNGNGSKRSGKVIARGTV